MSRSPSSWTCSWPALAHRSAPPAPQPQRVSVTRPSKQTGFTVIPFTQRAGGAKRPFAPSARPDPLRPVGRRWWPSAWTRHPGMRFAGPSASCSKRSSSTEALARATRARHAVGGQRESTRGVRRPHAGHRSKSSSRGFPGGLAAPKVAQPSRCGPAQADGPSGDSFSFFSCAHGARLAAHRRLRRGLARAAEGRVRSARPAPFSATHTRFVCSAAARARRIHRRRSAQRRQRCGVAGLVKEHQVLTPVGGDRFQVPGPENPTLSTE